MGGFVRSEVARALSLGASRRDVCAAGRRRIHSIKKISKMVSLTGCHMKRIAFCGLSFSCCAWWWHERGPRRRLPIEIAAGIDEESREGSLARRRDSSGQVELLQLANGSFMQASSQSS